VKRRAVLSGWGASLIAGAPAFAQTVPRTGALPVLGGIEIGAGIAAAVHTLGMPVDVASLDTGHLCTWRTPHADLQVSIDDDAVVRVVDEKPLDQTDSIVLSVDGKTVKVVLFGYTAALADAQLSPLVAFSTHTSRAYTITPTRQLVLIFSDDGTLGRAVYGERGVIARMSLLVTDAELLKNQHYYAPRMRTAPSPVPGASHETIVRYEIDKDGKVASLQVPVSSSDPAADERALQIARAARWTPAKYLAVPVNGVVFRMIGT
jgi:TonB family protein